jgi:predicted transcriptional regulator
MDVAKVRLLSEVKRGADLPACVYGSKLAGLASEDLIEKIPGTAEYDYRLTEKGRLLLAEEHYYEGQLKVAAE